MTTECLIVWVTELGDAAHLKLNHADACRVTATICAHANGVEGQERVIISLQENRPGDGCLRLEADVQPDNFVVVLGHARSAWHLTTPQRPDPTRRVDCNHGAMAEFAAHG